jgi:hypothetical protein
MGALIWIEVPDFILESTLLFLHNIDFILDNLKQ